MDGSLIGVFVGAFVTVGSLALKFWWDARQSLRLRSLDRKEKIYLELLEELGKVQMLLPKINRTDIPIEQWLDSLLTINSGVFWRAQLIARREVLGRLGDIQDSLEPRFDQLVLLRLSLDSKNKQGDFSGAREKIDDLTKTVAKVNAQLSVEIAQLVSDLRVEFGLSPHDSAHIERLETRVCESESRISQILKEARDQADLDWGEDVDQGAGQGDATAAGERESE